MQEQNIDHIQIIKRNAKWRRRDYTEEEKHANTITQRNQQQMFHMPEISKEQAMNSQDLHAENHKRNKRNRTETPENVTNNIIPRSKKINRPMKRYEMEISFTNPEEIKEYICLQIAPSRANLRKNADAVESNEIQNKEKGKMAKRAIDEIQNLLKKMKDQ